MTRYRAKPVEMEAVQWDGANEHEVRSFAGSGVGPVDPHDHAIAVHTGEGTTFAKPGFYICKDDRGGVYPCEPGVFERKYERIE